MNNFLINLLIDAREFKNHLLLNFVKPNYNNKVFCIGFNKTGTTSLGKSLEILGYNNSSFNRRVWRKYYKNKDYNKILNFTAKFDSVDDLPWLKEDMIPVLDKSFPKSKFIYLIRDEESWKKSIYNWTHQETGKYPDIEEKFEEYKSHKEFVLEYFKDRSDDFIVLNIKDPEGFKKLANFLGKKTERIGFPHHNKTK